MTDDPTLKVPRDSGSGRSYRAVAVAIVAVLAAGGIGYYAWTLRAERTTLSGQLAESQRGGDLCAKELTKNGMAIAQATQERDACRAEHQATVQKYQSIDDNLTTMQANLQASRTELEELRKQREESERRLQAFRDLTEKLKAMIDTGTIDVVVRRGSMLVELPAAVLFPSGSAQLSDDGKKALMEVGVILKKLPDRKFMVAGHTDDTPVGSAEYRNNWELSTARALNVLEFLVYVGMKPESLVAAGYGQFDPVASNKTKEGKARNRRIEIVLLPNLDEFPGVPEGIAGGSSDTQ